LRHTAVNSNTPHVGTTTEAAGEVLVHELYPFNKYQSQFPCSAAFLSAKSTLKKTAPFLALNAVTGFWKFKATSAIVYEGKSYID
jgi:hypothetical protein